MIKITVEQLRSLNACVDGVQWFKRQKETELKKVIYSLLKDNHFDYATWLFRCLLTREQSVLWAINSAELVINIFESQFPKDNRPRLTIEAARHELINPTKENNAFAESVAKSAIYAAYAAESVTESAAYAAKSAAYAAYAACAAKSAIYAAYAAESAARAEKVMEARICNMALILLGETISTTESEEK